MKRPRGRKALSPIFASLLILAIITILFIPIFIWSTGTTAGTQNFWNTQSNIETERIIIEEVNLRSTSSSFVIYIRDIGKTALTVDNVLLIEPNGNVQTYIKGTNYNPIPEFVPQGDLTTITINLGAWRPISGQTYTVKAFTPNGVGDQYQIVVS